MSVTRKGLAGVILTSALLLANFQAPALAASPHVNESTRKTQSSSKQFVIKGKKGKDTTYVALKEDQLAEFLYSMSTGDFATTIAMVEAKTVVSADAGTKVRLLETVTFRGPKTSTSLAKVRLMSGDGNGMEVWLLKDALR
ncbi:hypothetical protein D3C86_1294380 [compost metagenome]